LPSEKILQHYFTNRKKSIQVDFFLPCYTFSHQPALAHLEFPDGNQPILLPT